MGALFDLEVLSRRLESRAPRRVLRWMDARRAAVAIVLDAGGRVLLVRRAARAGDRWSRHVSLPGGMSQPEDQSAIDTAIRETREEVGVDLASAERLGGLDELRAIANGGFRPMSIAPFVFLVRTPIEPKPGPEVATCFWLPMEQAAEGTLDDRLRFPVLGVHFSFRCWRCENQTVWGLTLAILERIVSLARP